MTPDDALDQAFAAAPREWFLPATERRFAGLDRPLPIGHGQTNSQPTTVRQLLGHLDLRAGQRVLDVGCGSGWTTALLAHLVGPSGVVIGTEIVPELVDFGRANLARAGVPAQVLPADPEVLGRPGAAPYDRILVSAEAREVPAQLVDQLAQDDGVLVVPVAGRLAVVRRSGPHQGPEVRLVGHYAFVPLREPGHTDRGIAQ